jgi:hypothetical protein
VTRDPANTPPPIGEPAHKAAGAVDAAVLLDPADAARLAEAEEDAIMLRRLGQLAMALCEASAAKALAELAPTPEQPAPPAETAPPATPASPPSRRDPAETFIRMSRVVRLTVILRGKIAEEIADLRAGRHRPAVDKPPAKSPPAAASAHASMPGERVDPNNWALKLLPVDHPSAHRNKIRDCVYAVINGDRETLDFTRLFERLDTLYAGLIEGERYDAVIHRPLKETVAAICKDLGLEPDWGLWADDGFPDPFADTNQGGRQKMWQPQLGAVNTRRARPRDPPAVWPDPPPPLKPWQSPYPCPSDP